MDNFPSNAHTEKVQPKEADKKIEKVVTGDVVRRKTPLGKKFAETFVGGDAKSVVGYIMWDVLMPAAKDTVADAVSQGIERMLFGEARSTSRRTGMKPGGSSTYTNYSSRFAPSSKPYRSEDRPMSRRARANHEFDEIVLPTRVEADRVLERLYDLLSQYEVATVADLYSLVGVTGNYTDDKWGWTELRGSRVERIREGYLLDLPKPEPIDR